MRKLTAQGKSFSFVHATYNKEHRSTDGIRTVSRAWLRPAAKEDSIINADEKLFYFDDQLGKPRNAWQVLIMYFNGKKIKLN